MGCSLYEQVYTAAVTNFGHGYTFCYMNAPKQTLQGLSLQPVVKSQSLAYLRAPTENSPGTASPGYICIWNMQVETGCFGAVQARSLCCSDVDILTMSALMFHLFCYSVYNSRSYQIFFRGG